MEITVIKLFNESNLPTNLYSSQTARCFEMHGAFCKTSSFDVVTWLAARNEGLITSNIVIDIFERLTWHATL